MRKRRELTALIITAVVAVLVILGFFYFDLPARDGEVPPESHNIVEDAPEEVQDPPPSAVGDIDEP